MTVCALMTAVRSVAAICNGTVDVCRARTGTDTLRATSAAREEAIDRQRNIHRGRGDKTTVYGCKVFARASMDM